MIILLVFLVIEVLLFIDKLICVWFKVGVLLVLLFVIVIIFLLFCSSCIICCLFCGCVLVIIFVFCIIFKVVVLFNLWSLLLVIE